jgi:hypothetical protein
MEGIEIKHKEILDNVLGSEINEENLKLFFDIPTIKQLWWGKDGFISSQTYKNFFDNL